MIYFISDTEKSNVNRNPPSFNASKAVEYARKYALNYNTDYQDLNEIGGDCTNFVSQCLHFGGLPKTEIWKPYTSPWINVNPLYYYLIKNGYAKELPMNSKLKAGNVIQFFSNTKGYFTHTGIITKALLSGDYLYCCHSYDKLDYPLSFIYPIFYDRFRILDIIY